MAQHLCKLCGNSLDAENSEPISILGENCVHRICHDCADFNTCPICSLSLLEACFWKDSKEREHNQVKAAGASCSNEKQGEQALWRAPPDSDLERESLVHNSQSELDKDAQRVSQASPTRELKTSCESLATLASVSDIVRSNLPEGNKLIESGGLASKYFQKYGKVPDDPKTLTECAGRCKVFAHSRCFQLVNPNSERRCCAECK